MTNLIVWLVAFVVAEMLVCYLSSVNVKKMGSGRPRKVFKQGALDGLCAVFAAVISTMPVIRFLIPVAEAIAPFFNLKTEAPYFFSFLIIFIPTCVISYYVFHFSSVIVQELKFNSLSASFEQRLLMEEIRKRREAAEENAKEAELKALLEEIEFAQDIRVIQQVELPKIKAVKKRRAVGEIIPFPESPEETEND